MFEFEYSPRYYMYKIQLLFLKIIIHANEITQWLAGTELPGLC
jgi:hypothetical protein